MQYVLLSCAKVKKDPIKHQEPILIQHEQVLKILLILLEKKNYEKGTLVDNSYIF